MKRILALLVCILLLAGCSGNGRSVPADRPETDAAAETDIDIETDAETDAETEAEAHTETARPRALDPQAMGYIYLYAYPSAYTGTAYYCTDTPLAENTADGTRKEQQEEQTFRTNTLLPDAAESTEDGGGAPEETIVLLDVISCTEAYPTACFAAWDNSGDGYFFFQDGIWKAYRITDGAILPITGADPSSTDGEDIHILRDSAADYALLPGYILLSARTADGIYEKYTVYDLARDESILTDLPGCPCVSGDYLLVTDESSLSLPVTTLYELHSGAALGTIHTAFAEIHSANGKYYITAQDGADGEMPFSVYNISLEKIADSPVNQFTATSDGYAVVIEDGMTKYRIFDDNGTTIAESDAFERVVKLYEDCDYVCVVQDGWLQFRRRSDGAFLANLFPYSDDQGADGSQKYTYTFHTLISGYLPNGKEKGAYIIDYLDAEPDENGLYDFDVVQFAKNTGTAAEPVFTVDRYPDTLPPGVYITIEDNSIPDQTFPENGSARGIEYYLTDEGELFRLAFGFIGGYAKPVLYLYPETEAETEVRVSFAHPEVLTTVYPAYPDNGWHILATSDGTLRTIMNGKISERTYYALYWEESGAVSCDFATGFCVSREDSTAFLEESLAKLGLTDREANECILYWLPLLEKSPYNLICFELTESREAYNALRITPHPDSILRVALHILPVPEPAAIEAQVLPPFDRHGFTAVEWGGVYGG